jgi:hypothetical protein
MGEDRKESYLNFTLAVPPRGQWWLEATPTFRIEQATRPNWWFRMWQYLLLGWRWTKA